MVADRIQIGIIMLVQLYTLKSPIYTCLFQSRSYLLANEKRGHPHSSTKQSINQSLIQHQTARIICLPGTHAHNTHLRVLLLHLSQQGGRLSRTRRTNWVAQGNRTAVGVNLGHVQAQLADTVDALAGEGLVKFEDAHVALLNTAVFVEVADGEDGRDTHLVGAVTGHLRTGEPRNRLQSMSVSPCPAGEDGRRGTIRDLRPVNR